MEVGDEPLRNEGVMRQEGRNGKVSPPPHIILMLADVAQGQRRIELMQSHQHLGQERRNNIAAVRRVGVQSGNYGLLVSSNFQLDIKIGLSAVSRQDVFQACQIAGATTLEAGILGSGHFPAVEFRIVGKNRTAVTRETNIEFESVAAAGDSVIEGRKGIFGGETRFTPPQAETRQGTYTTMAKQQRT